ncbi:hypothetical protein GCM10009839_43070 [Catenulispora yoronensis]|uniref:Uncharacterized protein n=1 Tax=Catenulispora yoronensis TaxID=450799 RepID=A0ABP5FZB4_9ACTN
MEEAYSVGGLVGGGAEEVGYWCWWGGVDDGAAVGPASHIVDFWGPPGWCGARWHSARRPRATPGG